MTDSSAERTRYCYECKAFRPEGGFAVVSVSGRRSRYACASCAARILAVRSARRLAKGKA